MHFRWLLLAGAAALQLPLAAAQDYWIYSDITGAQTQVDINHTKDWTITLVPAATPLTFRGGQLMMKRGQAASADVVLTLYSGSSAVPANKLAESTLTSAAFGTAFNVETFQFPSGIQLLAGQTYYVALTSSAPDVQSQAYFIKGYSNAFVSSDGTTPAPGVTTQPASSVPILTLEKTGPATVSVGGNIVYELSIGNVGTASITSGSTIKV